MSQPYGSVVTQLTGLELLEVSAIGPNNFPSAYTETTTVQAIANLANQLNNQTNYAYNVNSTTTSATLSAANVTGGSVGVFLNLTGITASATMTTPAASSWVAALPDPAVDQTYMLRIIDSSGLSNTVTLVGGQNVTAIGTMTVQGTTQPEWRDLLVTVSSVSPAGITLQDVGAGTSV